MDALLREQLSRAIADALGAPFGIRIARPVGGGCIHTCYMVESDAGRHFLKLADASRAALLEAEADGLQAMDATGARVPAVIAQGVRGDAAFLLLEYLDLASGVSAHTQRALGRMLAQMHGYTNERYGWPRDNYIGLTPQHNTWHSDWIVFWEKQRLQPQLALAVRNGYGPTLEAPGDELLTALPALLDSRKPQAALLHGDLWSGNAAVLTDGTPVMFDPAVYYGDAEADLAMTELFGGFTPEFYAGYREVNAIDPGYPLRKQVYNLYHVLNHLNLFGGSYLRQAERTIRELLAEVR